MVNLHGVLFVGVLPVNSMGDVAIVVALGVRVQVVRDALVHVESSLLSVVVGGEDHGEGVSHLELTVESTVEHGALWVNGAIFYGTLGRGRLTIVFIVVGEAAGGHLRGNLSLETLLLSRLKVLGLSN
jgi:hypothetical protein